MNVRDCYSAMWHGVAKMYSELVALRLLYTDAHYNKTFKVVCFLRAGLILCQTSDAVICVMKKLKSLHILSQ